MEEIMDAAWQGARWLCHACGKDAEGLCVFVPDKNYDEGNPLVSLGLFGVCKKCLPLNAENLDNVMVSMKAEISGQGT